MTLTSSLCVVQGSEVPRKTLKAALQAAKAATGQVLSTQHKLAAQWTPPPQSSGVGQSQGYTGCDPAAEASIMSLAEPLVKKILSDEGGDMTRVQREHALKEAKAKLIEQLTNKGVYRFQVCVICHTSRTLYFGMFVRTAQMLL